jgi:hypothetical protein
MKERRTRCHNWWFIDIQYFLNMFRAPLHPSSGEQIRLRVTAYGSGCSCVGSGELCGEMCLLYGGCCRSYNQNTTPYAATRSLICCPDDGRKGARNMLTKYWISINHQLWHLVGLTFIYFSKMHGHSRVKFKMKVLCPSLESTETSVIRSEVQPIYRLSNPRSWDINKYTLLCSLFYYSLYLGQSAGEECLCYWGIRIEPNNTQEHSERVVLLAGAAHNKTHW